MNDTKNTIDHWWACAWTEDDETLLGAKLGDAGSQAVWEGYALLLAISTWQDKLENLRCTIELRGDALGVLQAVLARRGCCPEVNLIVAEIQLLLGRSMHDLFAIHIWSEDNTLADQLSRIPEGASIPDECPESRRHQVKRRRWCSLRHSIVREVNAELRVLE